MFGWLPWTYQTTRVHLQCLRIWTDDLKRKTQLISTLTGINGGNNGQSLFLFSLSPPAPSFSTIKHHPKPKRTYEMWTWKINRACTSKIRNVSMKLEIESCRGSLRVRFDPHKWTEQWTFEHNRHFPLTWIAAFTHRILCSSHSQNIRFQWLLPESNGKYLRNPIFGNSPQNNSFHQIVFQQWTEHPTHFEHNQIT